MEYIVMAIPVFFLLIGIEYVLSLITRRQLYRLNDSINDLSMGTIDQVGGVLFKVGVFALYLVLYKNARLIDMPADSVFVWVTCFLVKDFAYYWAHRMSHEVNVGWATHIAHHQSEEYNLSVALRQGVFQQFFFGWFYLPMALIGFPPVVFITCSAFNTIYQFWIHTRAIGKLGPLEWVLNTPSHHRVHHGRDLKYIDRNHAGVFIIWDRMFGTFQEEEEEPNFGLVTPLRSWNPLWAQVHYFVKLARTAGAAPDWRDKIRVWFKAPSFVPKGMETIGPSAQDRWNSGEYKKYDPLMPTGLKPYIALHFAGILMLAVGFLKIASESGDTTLVDYGRLVASSGLIFWTLLCLGGISESRKWVRVLEPVRLVAFSTVMILTGGSLFGLSALSAFSFPLFVAVNVGVAVVSLVWLLKFWKLLTTPFNTLETMEAPSAA